MMTWNHPQEYSFGIYSCCWHTIWGAYMMLVWHILPCCGSTESEWAFLKKLMDLPKTFLHWYISTLYYSQMVENISYPINVQDYEGGIYFFVEIWISTTLFRSMAFNIHLLWMEEGGILESHPLWSRVKSMPLSPWEVSCLNITLTPLLVNLGSITLAPQPMLISFGKFAIW